MDIMKLCKKLFEKDEIQEIPVSYVYTILNAIIELISSGECFYNIE